MLVTITPTLAKVFLVILEPTLERNRTNVNIVLTKVTNLPI
jgi:hypothetical protein